MSSIPRRRLLQTGAAAAMLPARAAATQRVALQIAAGRIEIELYLRQAPLSAGDFLKYVDRHAYDGGHFSRVVRPDNDHGHPQINVVQGGIRDGAPNDPPIPLETTRQTGLRHRDGTISLPRDTPNTGSGAAFFICIGDQPSLDCGGRRNPDGQGFAAFGQVVAGLDLVRGVWQGDASAPSGDAYTAGQMLRKPVTILRAELL